ncbi:DUF6286 domain-containing protein [Actinoalloteichus hymeniacidonis]|uniref:DUF6286 domain-containing protein n=1 Tax=Actinoalloteichus hymeniacidonis TaxID=340345 RepID=A0AAC9MYZ5_9PSEU|nr:DUF6286 domain-containing protein [Actinoalloteichus hymeniacidonis]AOS64888.1 hypothetical protein TL08_20485 [Actinoalloteichus hymeniacidonis]MBB5907037.1 hypothetical protein [Actinoalloteichus hymeniacidonis]
MRLLVRLLAILIGLVLAIMGALLLLEIGWTRLRPASDPLIVPWRAWLDLGGELSWSAGTPTLASLLAIGVGALLCVAAIMARRRVLHLHDPGPDVSVTTSGRSIARLIVRRVRAEDGVSDVWVNADHRHIRVRAVGSDDEDGELLPRLQLLIRDVVADLPLREYPRVSVALRAPRSRR